RLRRHPGDPAIAVPLPRVAEHQGAIVAAVEHEAPTASVESRGAVIAGAGALGGHQPPAPVIEKPRFADPPGSAPSRRPHDQPPDRIVLGDAVEPTGRLAPTDALPDAAVPRPCVGARAAASAEQDDTCQPL